MKLYQLVGLVYILPIFSLGFVEPLWCDQRLGEGFQLSLAGSYHLRVHSEFTGQSLPLEIHGGLDQFLIDIPELSKESYGFAGRIGYKGQKWGFEFQYNQNQMKKISSILSDDDNPLTMAFYDLNAKHYFLQHAAIKSYLIFGLGYATLSGSTLIQLPSLSFQSAEYSGICYNLGFGLNLFVNQNIFIFGDYIYRGLSYYQIDDQQLKEALSHPLHAFYIGIGYVIGGPSK